MDIENENLIIMKKHNRKIVQRAFQKSVANAQYKFPKTNLAPNVYSQMSESISICSRVSETYDLYQQNARFNRFQDQSRKIAPISSIFKMKHKNQQGCIQDQRLKTLMSSRRNQNGEKVTKRQFLSLTPNRQSNPKAKKSASIQRTAGINISRRKELNFTNQKSSSKNPQDQNFSLIETLQKMTDRCFGNDHNHIKQIQQIEAIFYDTKFDFTKQTLTKKGKITLSDKLTTDSTPLMGQKTTSSNKSKHKRGMSIIKLQQNVTVSPFLFN